MTDQPDQPPQLIDAAITHLESKPQNQKQPNDYSRSIHTDVIVWFSCGAASACAAKLATENYKASRLEIVYCDTFATEHPDNPRFLQDVQEWIQHPIRILKSMRYSDVDDVFEKRRIHSTRFGAPCTVEMKKRVRFEFQGPLDVHIFGMTSDEHERIADFGMRNPELRLHWILQENKISKQDCFKMIQTAGIKLPEMYALGYKNNNCMGCVKATSPAYFIPIRRDFPEVFARRLDQSERIGSKLVKVKGEFISLCLLRDDYLEVVEEDLSCGPQCSRTDDEE